MWTFFEDAPESFRKEFEYVTPLQTQVLCAVRGVADAKSAAAFDDLVVLFSKHVRRNYTAGVWHHLFTTRVQ